MGAARAERGAQTEDDLTSPVRPRIRRWGGKLRFAAGIPIAATATERAYRSTRWYAKSFGQRRPQRLRAWRQQARRPRPQRSDAATLSGTADAGLQRYLIFVRPSHSARLEVDYNARAQRHARLRPQNTDAAGPPEKQSLIGPVPISAKEQNRRSAPARPRRNQGFGYSSPAPAATPARPRTLKLRTNWAQRHRGDAHAEDVRPRTSTAQPSRTTQTPTRCSASTPTARKAPPLRAR